ncbi:hypothetical protein VB264_00005 [Arcicella aquatica]|uniref:Uncharacterized protein n=1 Tax=Arcicella aquatica TaxID=217141 RepID=A0ABU5QHE3_9BACT|nr:hypothetical protein [Arcicella aquatica]MEA5256144.1 hypothetical protein [Arcicella aquatica]
MGLDLVPMGKPKKGFEKRFNQIFRVIEGKETLELSFLDKLKGKKLPSKEELLEEWFANQISVYETLKAPQVGRDKEAEDWIKVKYQDSNKELSESDFIKKHKGYYILELAKEIDGLPIYIAYGQEEHVFRGEFLTTCIGLIDESLVHEAWETKLAEEALDYGNRLMNTADNIAKENNLEYLKNQRAPSDSEENDIAGKLHIVYSLARWLTFYGKNGHGYQADY